MMTLSRFLSLLLISAVLLLSLSQGYGRRIKSEVKHASSSEDGMWTEREMVEMMDYRQPGANTNPRSGVFFSSPPPHVP